MMECTARHNLLFPTHLYLHPTLILITFTPSHVYNQPTWHPRSLFTTFTSTSIFNYLLSSHTLPDLVPHIHKCSLSEGMFWTPQHIMKLLRGGKLTPKKDDALVKTIKFKKSKVNVYYISKLTPHSIIVGK